MTLRPSVLLMIFLPLWLAACYGLRFQLMEESRWVALCMEDPGRWACQLRAGLGLIIHWQVIAWAALAAAVTGFLLPGRAGWRLAALGLFLALPALVLYTATLGVFSAVIGGLRLVRR